MGCHEQLRMRAFKRRHMSLQCCTACADTLLLAFKGLRNAVEFLLLSEGLLNTLNLYKVCKRKKSNNSYYIVCAYQES